MHTNKLSNLTKLLIFCSGLALVVSIFVPLWRIDLIAPQYPEGLKLLIYQDAIGGNVEIINGLNHYIGMKTLHTKDFFEFTILPFIIGFFALSCFVTVLLNRKKWLTLLFISFLLFGIIAMVDFWRWEYNYGHRLDENAAIIVPGMSYQPPLIGFKQLLNFGAYSFPDIGGWLFIFAGLCLLAGVLREKLLNKKKLLKVNPVILFFFLLPGCTNKKPEPIHINTDSCTFCKMTISDEKFAAQLINNKGKVLKFDDMLCMLQYIKSFRTKEKDKYYVAAFQEPKNFLDATTCFYLKSSSIKSPMQGNLLAFPEKLMAQKYSPNEVANILSWQQILLP